MVHGFETFLVLLFADVLDVVVIGVDRIDVGVDKIDVGAVDVVGVDGPG